MISGGFFSCCNPSVRLSTRISQGSSKGEYERPNGAVTGSCVRRGAVVLDIGPCGTDFGQTVPFVERRGHCIHGESCDWS